MMPSRILFSCLLICAVVAMAIFAWLLATSSRAVINIDYSDYSDAISKSAADHGMVPSFLPKSATGIISSRNIDLDTLVVEFSFRNDDFEHFIAKQSFKSIPKEYDLPNLQGAIIQDPRKGDLLIAEQLIVEDEYDKGTMIIDKRVGRALYIAAQHRKPK